MKKEIMIVLVIGLMVMAMAAIAAEMNMGAATLVIPGGSKADITLPHQTHQKVLDDCDKCHNLYPEEAGVIASRKESGALKKTQVMKECLGCHKEMAAAGEKTGPTRCDGCHQQSKQKGE